MHRTSPLCTQNHKWNHKWNHKSKSVCKYNSFLTTWCSSQLFFCKTKNPKKKWNSRRWIPTPEKDTLTVLLYIPSNHAMFPSQSHVPISAISVFFLFFFETPWEQISKANKWDQPQTWASPHPRLPHAILTPSRIVLHRIRTATVAVPPK